MDDLILNTRREWADTRAELLAQGIEFKMTEAQQTQLELAWTGSEYLRQGFRLQPRLLQDLIYSGELERALEVGEQHRQLTAALADCHDDPKLHQVLRRFRRRQMTRIIWRDLADLASLEETLEDLSEMADVCIAVALDWLQTRAIIEWGQPRDAAGEPQSLVVLGMGKLGARELNLSSDIDLIFAYPQPGEVSGGRRALTNEQFFIRLSQRLVQALHQNTADGFAFRVDTRLRPYGDAGPLAMSFSAMEDYYQSQAREWERYAMIKARVVAGDAAAGAVLMALLRPFVYRRYLDFGAIASLRELKSMIVQELHKKGMDANIKLGAGGIREIEFIGQAFQLIRGGRDPKLQQRGIVPVLQHLGEQGMLPPVAVDALLSAYRWLRRVENRLQAWQDRQTHVLPAGEDDRRRLAFTLGFPDWASCAQELEAHRERVQRHFDHVFAAPTGEAADDPLQLLWQGALEPEARIQAWIGAGFQHAAECEARLTQFRESAACRRLSARGRDRLDQLMPAALAQVARSAEPDRHLDALLQVLVSIVRRTAYLALLVEHGSALAQLIRLIGLSPWVTQQIAAHPLLLDELLDARRLYSPLEQADLRVELAALLASVSAEDLEQQMDRLRQFVNSNRLRVAAADLTGAIPLTRVSDFLTAIAEVTVNSVLQLAWEHLVSKHGRPSGIAPGQCGFTVIAYGKLGGIELGYGSDLDLVFLHAAAPGGCTDGARPVANEVFYARLTQRMIHLFTTLTPAGVLYAIDMRLRPNGASGLLVTDMQAFSCYQLEKAWTWEHQALLRARPIAGDADLSAAFLQLRRQALGRPRDVARLRNDVVEMRERMRGQLDASDGVRFDLKQGAGGIADIEFMVQYGALRWACEFPDLLDWTDNLRQLETLARRGVLDEDLGRRLTLAYTGMRATLHRCALRALPPLVAEDQHRTERQMVQKTWQCWMLEGTDACTAPASPV